MERTYLQVKKILKYIFTTIIIQRIGQTKLIFLTSYFIIRIKWKTREQTNVLMKKSKIRSTMFVQEKVHYGSECPFLHYKYGVAIAVAIEGEAKK